MRMAFLGVLFFMYLIMISLCFLIPVKGSFPAPSHNFRGCNVEVQNVDAQEINMCFHGILLELIVTALDDRELHILE